MASNIIEQRLREKHQAAKNETAGTTSAVSASGGSIADIMRAKSTARSSAARSASQPPEGAVRGFYPGASGSAPLVQAAREMAADDEHTTLPVSETGNENNGFWGNNAVSRFFQNLGWGMGLSYDRSGALRNDYADWQAETEKQAQEHNHPLGQRLGEIGSAAGKTYAGSMLGAYTTGYEALASAYEKSADAMQPFADWITTGQRRAYEDYYESLTPEERERLDAGIQATLAKYDYLGGARRLEQEADELTASGQEDLAKATEDLGTIGRLATNTAVAGSQMAADVLLSGGQGAMLPMVIRSFGGGAQEARNRGYSREQQIQMGLANAAIEFFSEKLFGGNPVYDDDVGLVNMLVSKVTQNEKILGYLSSLPADILYEGLEEVVSDVLNPLAEYAIAGEPIEYNAQDIIESGIVGMMMAGVGQGGQAVANTARYASQGRRISGDENAQDMISARVDIGLSADPSTEAYKLAQKVQAQTAAGSVSNATLGRLDEAVRVDQALRDQADVLALAAIMNENEDGNLPYAYQRRLDENPYAAQQYARLKAQQKDAQARTETASEGTDTTAAETRAEARETPQETAAETRAEARETPQETAAPAPAASAETTAEAKTPAAAAYSSEITRGADGMYTLRVTDADGNVMTEQPYESAEKARAAAADLGLSPALYSDTANIRQQLRRAATESGVGEEGTDALLRYAPESAENSGAYFDEFSRYYNAGRQSAENNGDYRLDFLEVEAPENSAVDGAALNDFRADAFTAGRRDVMLPRSAVRAAEPFHGSGMQKVDYAYAAEAYGIQTADRIQDIAKRLGTEIRFVDLVDGGLANASIDGRVILMEKGNRNPVFKILGHEWTHRMQDIAPEAYNEFRDAVKGSLTEEVEAIKDNYQKHGKGISDAAALDEAVADYAGDMLADGRILDDFIEANRNKPTLLRRMWEAVKALLEKLTGAEKQTVSEAEQRLRAALAAAEKAAIAEDMKADSNAAEAEEDAVRYSLITDKELRERLERGDTVTVYRAMQIIDGKLYPPMAAKVAEEAGKGKKRQLVEPTQINEWYQSDERPELADENGMFTLDKGNGKTIKARYNPYFHTSATPLNDQFSSAYARPNLVTVEAVIPKSELTSGYKAEKAKDAVGEVQWHSGPVASQLKGDKARRVFLSRWTKVTRIMPDAEVARIVARTLEGEKVAVPSNVVTPSLLAELEKQGVPIEYTTDSKAQPGETAKRLSLKTDADYLAAVERGDMETAQRMVDEAAKEAGYNYIRYTRRKQSARNNDADYYMFSESDGHGRDDLRSVYGQYGYYASDAGSIDVSDIIDDLREAWRGYAKANGYESSIDDGELNPNDIVMSAGVWDDRDFVAWLFEHGIIDYDTVSVKTHDGLVVFDSARVKSADPVTYDDDGNVIPLSERFNPEKTDIRYSRKSEPEIDADGVILSDGQREYFADSKARDENGRLLTLYHGGFSGNVFSGRGDGFTYNPNAIYLTDSKEVAKAYAGRGNVLSLYALVKNPLILDAQGRSYTDIPIPDDAPQSLKDYFWADGTADADNLPVYAEENGYDGVIIRNVREGVGGGPMTEVIALSSEQVKRTDNENPTRNPDIRFSMKAPVEETDRLIAWHNIRSSAIDSAIELGGLAMPSFAVKTADKSHDSYGDISVIAYRDSIDPQRSKSQRIFAGDAWTPVFPDVGIKISYDAAEAAEKRVRGLLDAAGYDSNVSLALDTDILADQIKRRGSFEQAYGDNREFKVAFLQDTGRGVRMPMQEKVYSRLADIATLRRVAREIDLDGARGYDASMQHEPVIRRIVHDYYVRKYGQQMADRLRPLDKALSFDDVDNVIHGAREYRHSGETRQIDTKKLDTRLENAMRGKKIQAEYHAWLKDLSKDFIERRGVRNNKELFKPSGNRRSFNELYDEYNLANIVKAMRGQPQQGRTQFLRGQSAVKGAALEDFSTIEQVRAQRGRLISEADETSKKAYDDFNDSVKAIADRISEDPFTGSDMLADILSHAKTKAAIERYLRSEYDFLRIQDHLDLSRLAGEIYELGQEANTLPMEYFEAKVYRAFPFSEAAAVVVPSTMPQETRKKLEDLGANVVTYKAGDNADRLAKVNSVEGARFSLKASDETSTAAQLMRENERLAERVAHFKGQLRLTKDWTADDKAVRRLARSLLDEFDAAAQFDAEERAALAADLKEIVEYAHRGVNDKDYEARLRDMTYGVARQLVKSARVLSEGSDVDLYNEVRRRLKEPMILDARYAHDISPDAWGDWRREHRGRVNVSINGSGTPVDTAYQELSEAYPWLFPAEITNPADQVLQMVEAIDTLTPVFENPYSSDMAYAIDYAANAVLDSVMDDALQAAPTFADRKKAQIQAERKANWEHTQEMMRRVRGKRDEQIQRIMDANKEANRRRAERREESKERTRLLNIAKRLQNKKLPAVTRALLDQYIGDLDTVAKSITGAKLEELSAIRDWYEKQKATDPDFIADAATEAKIARLSKRRIADMSQAEVAQLTEILLNIENELRNERRIIDSEDRRDTRQMALESIYNVEETEGSKKNLADWIADNTLSPLRLLRRLTGYVETDPLYLRTQELADGQRRMLDYQMRAERLFSKWANDEKFIDRIRRKERIKITALENGAPVEVEITPDMRMALYLHSLNDQNLRHIARGGITIPDIGIYLKGDLKEAYARGRTVVLSPSNIRAICSQMSEAEKAYARAAHDYFNGMSRDEVNATSEKLVGYSIAGVDNYFPIETDRNFTKANIDELKRDGTIEGMGFLKERVNASNAINLVPMTDVLKRSIQNHAKYVGLAVPIRNFGKIWGMNAQNDVAGESNGLRKAISSKWGSRGVEAIENMITDLQSGYARSDDIDQLFGKIRSNYAGAVLSLNLSVALKQAASYPTAAAVLGWGPLAKAMKDVGRVDLDRIAKYTPLQWYRSQGFSTQELGDIKARRGLVDKALNAKIKVGGKDVPLFNWIQGVDLLTTRKLWKASEYYVRDNNKDLKIGSEEYYRAVADVYNRVIEETQPNYTTMQRPQLLRSKSAWAEMLGMFKTQPFQNFNVLYDAIGELRTAERMAKNGDDSKLKSAKRNAANAVSSQIVQLAVFAAMTALWGALRKRDDKWRDKDGEMTLGSVLGGIGKDMLSGAASMIPAGADIYNLIESLVTGGKYYGASSVTVSAISDAGTAIYKAGSAISKAVSDPENISYSALGKAMENLVLEGSKALGVPAENIRNNVQIVMRRVLRAADGPYLGDYEFIRLTENMESSYVKGDVYDLLYRAYTKDPAAHRALYNQMVKDGFKPDSIKNAMEKRMKEAQGVKSVKDLNKRYSAP